MPITLFSSITEADKNQAVEKLIAQSTGSQDFFLMVVLSVLMATFGLLADSGAVIIGSMLIAPILSPILSLSLGITMVDFHLIFRSSATFIKSIALAVGFSALVTSAMGYRSIVMTSEIASRTSISSLHLVIAVIAGLAASFAQVKIKLRETIPGIAISVSLIPPIAVTGIGIATRDWMTTQQAFLLFLANAGGIVVASIVIFQLMHFYAKKNKAERTIKIEDKKLKREVSRAVQNGKAKRRRSKPKTMISKILGK